MSTPQAFGGIASKVLTIGKKIAPIAGAAQAWLADPMADGRGWNGAVPFAIGAIQDGIGKGKIANPLLTTKLALGMPDKYPITTGIAAAIAGIIGEEVGKAVDFGIISSFGTMLKRYGISAALNSVVSAWIYLARWNPHGGSGASQGYTTGGSQTETTQGTRSTQPDTLWQSRGGAQFRQPPAASTYTGR